MNKLLLIAFLLCSTIVFGQPNGAPTPAAAWGDTRYWFVADQSINDAGDGWDYLSDFPNAKPISFNKTPQVFSYSPILTNPPNSQSNYDGQFDWSDSPLFISYDEFFIIKVPGTGKVDIEVDISNNTEGSPGVTLQWYEFQNDVTDIAFLLPPFTDPPAYKDIRLPGDDLVFNLDEDSSVSHKKINSRYILIRIGITDMTFIGFGVINNYEITISTSNNICENSLKFPDTFLPFRDTTNTLYKDSLNGVDELTVTEYTSDRVSGVRGVDDLILPSGTPKSPGLWFEVTTEDTALYFATCESEFDVQLVVFDDCPSNGGLVLGAENDNLSIGDNFNNGTDVCEIGTSNILLPVIKDSTGASSGNPKTLYAYLFGNDDMGLFNLYLLKDGGGILPVEWLDFNGMPISSTNLLQWSTASEDRNDYFLLEKSVDGENYSELGRVQGAGNSIFEKTYSIIDKNPHYLTYYRIAQVDYDGTLNYGPQIVVVNESIFFRCSILKQPIDDGLLKIEIDVAEGMEVDVAIYSLSGHQLLDAKYMLAENKNRLEINTSHLVDGVYILKINNRMYQFTKKIIIQSLK